MSPVANSMIPNDCSTATGFSPRLQEMSVRFSISTSDSQPVFVTAKRRTRKTRPGPVSGERSTHASSAAWGGAGSGMTGGVPPEPQPAARSTAPSATRTATGRCTRPCSHTRAAARAAWRPVAQRFFDSLPRGVDLYEYQGKELFRRVGIPVSDGRLATTPDEARQAAEVLGGPVVVKAQVLTGGRGKAGGVKLAATAHEAEEHAKNILGLDIQGHVVQAALDRAGVGHREGVLPLADVRPRREEAAVHVHDAGRRRDRAGGRGEPRRARAAARRPARGLPRLAGAPARLRRRGHRPVRAEADRAIIGKLLRRVRPLRRDALRDQPADRDAGRRASRRSTRSSRSTTTRSTGTPTIAEMRDEDAADPLEALAREKHVTYVKLDGEVGVLRQRRRA